MTTNEEGSGNRSRHSRRRSLVVFGLVLVGAGLAYTYRDYLYPGPTRETSEFGIPHTLDDGRTGVFTYSRSVYRKQHQGGFIFGGSRRFYFIDVKYIGTYDLATGDAKIVYRKEYKRGGDARGIFALKSAAENMVLLTEWPTHQVDYVSPGRWLLFNLKDSSMTELPLKQELEERNLDMDHPRVVKNDGTILINTNYLETDGLPRSRFDPPNEVFLRLPSGEYIHVATCEGGFGFRGDEVAYHILKGRLGSVPMAYSITTRTARDLTRSEADAFAGTLDKERSAGLWVSADRKQLETFRRDGGTYVSTPVRLKAGLFR